MHELSHKSTEWHWPHLILLTSLPVYGSYCTGSCQSLALPGWLLLNLLLLGWAEHRQRYRSDWTPSAPDLRRDGIVASINIALNAAIGVILTMLAAAWAAQGALWALSGGLSTQPLALQLVIGLAVSELASYLLHRASHRDGWLWRAHLMHHLPPRVNLANSLTAHPVNAILDQLVRTGPLLLLGLDARAITLIAMFQLTQSLISHANINGRIGPLNYLLGSVEQHRLHHSNNTRDAGNYGTALPLWDQLFGTWRYGNAPKNVGVYEPGHYPHEHALIALMIWPWRRSKRSDQAAT